MINRNSKNALLYNGVEMPYVGYGLWKVGKDEAVKAITTALSAGYRHIDTATIYENEAELGEAIKQSSIKRNELFITTKVWNDDQGYDSTLQAFDTSLQKLGTSYIDLYLVHWPITGKFVETYKAIERLYDEKMIRAIGVSNFHIHHLQTLEAKSNIKPMVNQIECHPALNQNEVLAYCREQGIQLEAWSPLMRAGDIFSNPAIIQLSKKYGKTPAQIVLRWNLDRNVIVIPKSITESRIYENIDVFDFSLTSEEMLLMETLHTGTRIGRNPDTV